MKERREQRERNGGKGEKSLRDSARAKTMSTPPPSPDNPPEPENAPQPGPLRLEES